MILLVGIPTTIAQGMSAEQEVFCREAEFEHVSRYLSGLLLSENKTEHRDLQSIVYLEGAAASRRAMHAAVLEAGLRP